MSAIILEDNDHRPTAPAVLRIGLLGCGTVGSPVAKALLEDAAELERASGVPLELARVAVRHPHKARPVHLPSGIVTTDAVAVAIDPDIDIVIEVIGGIGSAREAILGALGDNKTVVTANKELLAGAGAHLLDDPGVALYFEASVCGAIPVVRTLKGYRATDRVEGFTGIFSGTCNFVLSRMTESLCSLDEALAEAQRLGFAEADPSADIEGFDAAAKVALLARVAFGKPFTIDDVERKGISGIDRARIEEARSEGLVYKLVGGGRRVDGRFDLWVGPRLVARDDPLAGVDGPENAVSIETARGESLRLQGPGAGGDPTAAAILGDLVTAARSIVGCGNRAPCFSTT